MCLQSILKKIKNDPMSKSVKKYQTNKMLIQIIEEISSMTKMFSLQITYPKIKNEIIKRQNKYPCLV